MKKLILSILVVLAMPTVVVGCGSSNTPGPTPMPTPTPTLAPTPTVTVTLAPTSTAIPTVLPDLQEMQGTWMGEGNEITFSGNSYTFSTGDGVQRLGTLTLNPATNPKSIDLYVANSSSSSDPFAGKTALGIYQLSGTNLTIALAGDPDAARPAELTDGAVFNFAKQPSSSNTPGLMPTLTLTPTPAATSTPIPTPTPASSNMELEGTWTETVAVPAGTFTFSGNSFTLTIPGVIQQSGVFTINSAASPKTIDVYFATSTDPSDTRVGTTALGIYQLSGTSLTLEFGDTDTRPTSFAGNGFNLAKQ